MTLIMRQERAELHPYNFPIIARVIFDSFFLMWMGWSWSRDNPCIQGSCVGSEPPTVLCCSSQQLVTKEYQGETLPYWAYLLLPCLGRIYYLQGKSCLVVINDKNELIECFSMCKNQHQHVNFLN